MDRRDFVRATGFATVGSWLMRGRRAQAAYMDAYPDATCQVIRHSPAASEDILLSSTNEAAVIFIDPKDYPVAHLAAGMLVDDLERVTGKRPTVVMKTRTCRTAIIIGTLGKSRWVDSLVAKGKLDATAIRGRWEASLWQTVEHPLPGIDQALVIAGSDRRGTAYGVMDLCEGAGVSPWYWWADVPVRKSPVIAVTAGRRLGGEPRVKYRGIFINDEDWGFQPWAAKTFDPELGNVGPKTYRKVFELMLRLKLNYLWPAMHPCSTPFGAIPENSALADQYAIVMGSSHVEPMLGNPTTFFKKKTNGPWNFVTNSKNILKFWLRSVKSRGSFEAIWTIGMRGPVDGPLLGVHGIPQEQSLVQKIFALQRAILHRYVTPRWGPVAECYVPYKEALLIFNAGLKVPADVTVIWPENNFGYVRQLSTPEQRKRPGGAGVYYHIEYLGGPHSYCWLNTTPPALIWEELRKAWDNDACDIWVINVGGIKPREVGVDFAARLAWNPEAFGPNAQPRFLRAFARSICGEECAGEIADLLRDYYLLGQMRKPEFMNRKWAASLPDAEAEALLARYRDLLRSEASLAAKVPTRSRDAFFEMFGYPAQMLAATGLIFLNDRLARTDQANASVHEQTVTKWRAFIEQQVARYNNTLAHGKWRHYATMGGTTLNRTWAAVQWPWLERVEDRAVPTPEPAPPLLTIHANRFLSNHATAQAGWREVQGLGWSDGAMALWPAVPANRWDPNTQMASAPRMEYTLDVPTPCANGEIILRVLPTYELYPGMKLRVAVRWNNLPPRVLEVPFASSETRVVGNAVRSASVLSNQIALRMPVGQIPAGKCQLTVFAVDPGIVLDQIAIAEHQEPELHARVG